MENCLERQFPRFLIFDIFPGKRYHKPCGRHAVKRYFSFWEEIFMECKKGWLTSGAFAALCGTTKET